MSLMLGYQRRMKIILWVSVVVLVILVQIFQSIGSRATIRSDKRLRDTDRKKLKNRKPDKAGFQ